MRLRGSSRTGLLALSASAVFVLAGCSVLDDADIGPSNTLPSSAAPVTPPPAPTPIVDSGSTPGAAGSAELNDDGTLTYTVVEGDITGVVCDRFGISGMQLDFEDGRGGATCYVNIDPGELLNLDSSKDGFEAN
jgi:hypothetical protein